MEDIMKNIVFETLETGESEIFRIYYDKNSTSFNEILIIEQVSLYEAHKEEWKILKAFGTSYIQFFLVCKN